MASNFNGAQPDPDSDSVSRLDSTRHCCTPLALAVKPKPIGGASRDETLEGVRVHVVVSTNGGVCLQFMVPWTTHCTGTGRDGGGQTDGRSFLTFEQSNRNRNVRQNPNESLWCAYYDIWGQCRGSSHYQFHSASLSLNPFPSHSHATSRNQLNSACAFSLGVAACEMDMHIFILCVCLYVCLCVLSFAGSGNMEI